MTRKIVQLSSIHKANDIRIFHKECRSLAAAGYDVVLIARAEREEVIDGVAIRPVRQAATNRLVRMTRTVFEVFRMAREERGDACHFHSIEFIPAGIVLKLLGNRVVWDVHEDFPKMILSKEYLPVPLRAPIARLTGIAERLGSWCFDGIVAATPSIAERFPADKTIVIHNYAMADEFAPGAGVAYDDRDMQVTYIGGLTEERGLFEMIDAVEIVNRTRPVTLVLGGPYQPESLRAEAAKRPGWKHVEDLGWLNRDEVAAVMGSSRAGLLIFLPVPNHFDSNPNKLFEYMAAGLPMITSNFPSWRQFVTDIGNGLMIDPESPEAIAEGILWMLEHPQEAAEMGLRGRSAFEERFTWEREADRLAEFYRTRIFA